VVGLSPPSHRPTRAASAPQPATGRSAFARARGAAAPLLLLAAVVPGLAAASGSDGIARPFLWIPLLLLIAKVSGLVERFGLPGVLGELAAGVLVGNLALVGIGVVEPVRHDEYVKFLAELGVVILLFQIGLESSIQELRRVGTRALLVALVGVVVPFFLGTSVVGPLLFPGQATGTYLFFGATLTATSVGITARVFKDLRFLRAPEAQIVLGAAVIDDVIGLMILAAVSAVVTTGSVGPAEIAWVVAKAVLFLGGAIVVGHRLAPTLSRLLSRVQSGPAMKFTLAISVCLVLAFLAHVIGLAPIVGAFAAGLILDEVTFRDFPAPALHGEVRTAVASAHPELRRRVDQVLGHHASHHLQSLIEPVGHLLVPLFFVYTGMQVNLRSLADPTVVVVALAVTALAVAGKLASGAVAGPVNRWLVGWAMVPRGEVGLIFAVVGKTLGVVNDAQFSVFVIMVMLTTLVTPPVLALLINRRRARAEGLAPAPIPTTEVLGRHP
jgi:Kef-type K+ transport system membrane component KefB